MVDLTANLDIWELESMAKRAVVASTPEVLAQVILVTTGLRIRVAGTVDHPSRMLQYREIEVSWGSLLDRGTNAFQEALDVAVAGVRAATGRAA